MAKRRKKFEAVLDIDNDVDIDKNIEQAENELKLQTLPSYIIEAVTTIDSGIINDYNSSREGLRIAIEVTKKSIAVMLKEFTNDATPRAAEAMAQLINSMTTSSKALIDNIKTISELYLKIKNNDPENKTINNTFNDAIIVGSLAEAMAINDKSEDEE